MTLKCRKGDLAVVIKGVNLGRILEVLEFVGRKTGSSGRVYDDVWKIKCGGETHEPSGMPYMISDSWLLPIRPGDPHETEETEREIENA